MCYRLGAVVYKFMRLTFIFGTETQRGKVLKCVFVNSMTGK